MTKKQLKQLAAKLAKLEQIIQANEDSAAVARAKDEQIRLSESSELELDDMIKLDIMIQEILKK